MRYDCCRNNICLKKVGLSFGDWIAHSGSCLRTHKSHSCFHLHFHLHGHHWNWVRPFWLALPLYSCFCKIPCFPIICFIDFLDFNRFLGIHRSIVYRLRSRINLIYFLPFWIYWREFPKSTLLKFVIIPLTSSRPRRLWRCFFFNIFYHY